MFGWVAKQAKLITGKYFRRKKITKFGSIAFDSCRDLLSHHGVRLFYFV